MRRESTSTHRSQKSLLAWMIVCFLMLIPVGAAYAHGVSSADRETMIGGGAMEYIWLGATHMLTGYDHLLFLFGVIFFLTGFRDVVRFITAFTLGHCITLLGATLAGIGANAHLIDAVIAVSVMYKGFENLGGFKCVFKRDAPNLLWVVFGFGLIHGFGLSTRLQDLPLGDNDLIIRILSFNVGVELGQIAALCVMVMFFKVWRKSASFIRFSTIANQGLVLAGLGLLVFQMVGFFTELNHPSHHEQPVHEHRESDDHHGQLDQDLSDFHLAPRTASPEQQTVTAAVPSRMPPGHPRSPWPPEENSWVSCVPGPAFSAACLHRRTGVT